MQLFVAGYGAGVSKHVELLENTALFDQGWHWASALDRTQLDLVYLVCAIEAGIHIAKDRVQAERDLAVLRRRAKNLPR